MQIMCKGRSVTLNPINLYNKYTLEMKGAEIEALRGTFHSCAQDTRWLKVEQLQEVHYKITQRSYNIR